MAVGQPDPHFDIDPNIVFQLGDELITDVVTALVELVKNSYDADASYARVIVDTEGRNPDQATHFKEALGYIVVEDDGEGMDEQAIRNGWLLISASPKRKMKLLGLTTKKQRTPLGDKGVGRLGTQRLGQNVEITTRKKGAPTALHVSFSWEMFRHVKKLSEVTAQITPVSPDFKHGTRLVISGLSDATTWTDKNSLNTLQTDLSKLISPYKEIRDFVTTVSINGNPIDLAEVGSKAQRAATIHYQFTFDGRELSILGRSKMALFRSQNVDPVEFHDLLECDNGDAFLKFLSESKEAGRFQLRRSTAKDWLIDARSTISLDDIQRLTRSQIDGEVRIANPGPFNGRIDAFDLSPSSLREQNVFDASKQFRDYVDKLSGVRVYRDGFGVRVDPDWLGLGEAWTSGGSYYGLKPSNTMGYVAISAKDNAGLVETTDREAFKRTPEYDNFYTILQEVVKFTSDVQETLRRSFVEYRKTRRRQEAGVTPDVTAEQLTRRVTERLARAKDQRTAVRAIGRSLEDTQIKASAVFEQAVRMVGNDTSESLALKTMRDDAQVRIAEAIQLIQRLDEHIRDLADLRAQGQVLFVELQSLRSRLTDMYEMVGLGLTAEALSHEIHNIADRLAARARDILRHIEHGKADPKFVSFVENVRSAVGALRKQLSHLAPSLRYVREQREKIELDRFSRHLAEYYEDRFKGKKIGIAVTHGPNGSFSVQMNKGKLTQIFDNVLLNSQYWLEEDLAAERIHHGKITIEVDAPFVRISDNGVGIHTSIEETLFEPFVTRKPRGVGRGLGLFIVRQLLDSEGCYISLLPKRNEWRRRYIFQFDLSGNRTND